MGNVEVFIYTIKFQSFLDFLAPFLCMPEFTSLSCLHILPNEAWMCKNCTLLKDLSSFSPNWLPISSLFQSSDMGAKHKVKIFFIISLGFPISHYSFSELWLIGLEISIFRYLGTQQTINLLCEKQVGLIKYIFCMIEFGRVFIGFGHLRLFSMLGKIALLFSLRVQIPILWYIFDCLACWEKLPLFFSFRAQIPLFWYIFDMEEWPTPLVSYLFLEALCFPW